MFYFSPLSLSLFLTRSRWKTIQLVPSPFHSKGEGLAVTIAIKHFEGPGNKRGWKVNSGKSNKKRTATSYFFLLEQKGYLRKCEAFLRFNFLFESYTEFIGAKSGCSSISLCILVEKGKAYRRMYQLNCTRGSKSRFAK